MVGKRQKPFNDLSITLLLNSVFSSSIKENINFNVNLNQKRYKNLKTKKIFRNNKKTFPWVKKENTTTFFISAYAIQENFDH